MEWKKYLSTEFLAFVAGVTIATVAMFEHTNAQTFAVNFGAWGAFVGGLAINLGVTRNVAKKIANGKNTPD